MFVKFHFGRFIFFLFSAKFNFPTKKLVTLGALYGNIRALALYIVIYAGNFFKSGKMLLITNIVQYFMLEKGKVTLK